MKDFHTTLQAALNGDESKIRLLSDFNNIELSKEEVFLAIASEMAKPSLEEGTALKNQGCLDLYICAITAIVDPDNKQELDYSALTTMKTTHEASMTIKQKDAATLSNFVIKHRLNDLEYWKEQITWLEKKEAEWNKQKIEISKCIAAMHDIIQNKKTTPIQKLEALSLIPRNHSTNRLFSKYSKRLGTDLINIW